MNMYFRRYITDLITGENPLNLFPNGNREIDFLDLQPSMIKNRGVDFINKVYPDFNNDLSALPEGAVVYDLGCGTGKCVYDIAKLGKKLQLQGVDRQLEKLNFVKQLYYNLITTSHVHMVTADLENQYFWDKIDNKSIDYAYSFFVGMYLREPFVFLKNLQTKLQKSGKAIIHMGYNIQYMDDKDLLDVLRTNSPYQFWSGENEVSGKLIPIVQHDNDAPHIDLSISLRPLFFNLTAETDLSVLPPLKSNLGYFISYEGCKYQLSSSDQRYTYSIEK